MSVCLRESVMPDRVAVFIDGGYFDRALEKMGGLRPDYERFSDKVCRGTERLRTYYYHCYPHKADPPSPAERQRYASMDRFLHSLRLLRRFEVRTGRLQAIGGTYRQKGIDTLLSIDMVELAATGHVSEAVLVSGDSDFAPAVRRAKDKGLLVALFYSPAIYVHDELFEACDDRIPMTAAFFADCTRS